MYEYNVIISLLSINELIYQINFVNCVYMYQFL